MAEHNTTTKSNIRTNTCQQCGQTKPISGFFKFRRSGHSTVDTVCASCRTLNSQKTAQKWKQPDVIYTSNLYPKNFNIQTHTPSPPPPNNPIAPTPMPFNNTNFVTQGMDMSHLYRDNPMILPEISYTNYLNRLLGVNQFNPIVNNQPPLYQYNNNNSNNNNNNNIVPTPQYPVQKSLPPTTTPPSSSPEPQHKKVASKRKHVKKSQQIDLRISYDELSKLVPKEVFEYIKRDKFKELIIFSNNSSDIVAQLPNNITRKSVIIDELISFYHIIKNETICTVCKKEVSKVDCFNCHKSLVCKDCSLKVDSRDISDWNCVGESKCLLQCVRCKHVIPYHKFLKYNRKDEIKRQNTCSYCRLKQWIDYYHS